MVRGFPSENRTGFGVLAEGWCSVVSMVMAAKLALYKCIRRQVVFPGSGW